MKKIAFVLAVLFCVTAFVSCTKSGVYAPKDKISAVWFERESVTKIDGEEREYKESIKKYQREAWEWEKKELKSRIVYNTDASVRSNYVYEYNKKDNRLIGITSPLPRERKTNVRFVYDDDKVLKEVRYFTEDFPERDLPYKKLEFTYDKGKVSTIKETINTLRYPRAYSAEPSLLSCLLSEEMANCIESNAICSKVEYDIKVNEYTFEWNKKNISNVTIVTTVGSNSTTARISYTYDEKKNPLAARVAGYVEDGDADYTIASKNNVTSCSYEAQDLIVSEGCEYTYDKKFPVEKVITRTERRNNMTKTTKETWSYEYLE